MYRRLLGGFGLGSGFGLADGIENLGFVYVAHAPGHCIAVLAGLGGVNFFGEVAHAVLEAELGLLGGLNIVMQLKIALNLQTHQNHQMKRP